ncbi:MAG: sigma-70 family RNA polymerase sigma factor [Bacteroidales bacterium]|nr:sigma-70 family RNA polymerase sigma factor [Bacteroidales bacterium]
MTRERFIELASAEQEPLRRFLLALCGGDRMEAEDIAQEAFIKAWLASERFDERYKFRTWLFKIAYRTLLDHAKRPRLERLSEVSEGSELSEKSEYTADAAFRYEALYRAIDQLPNRVRAATLLYHIEGYSIKDIATITHSNPVAVRQQLHRGLTRLREILKS